MYSCESEVVYFVFQRTLLPFFKALIKNLCPRQGPKIAGIVLHWLGIFGLFCPKQGQGLSYSAAHLYPNIGRVPPPPRELGIKGLHRVYISSISMSLKCLFLILTGRLNCIASAPTSPGNTPCIPLWVT